MHTKPKFYYRDLKKRGIHYQKWPELNIFVKKYTALDGTEREKRIRLIPSSDAHLRYYRMVSKLLASGKARYSRGIIRRYVFKYWLWAMCSDFWFDCKVEYKLKLLSCMLRFAEKYIISGKMPRKFFSQNSLNIVMRGILFQSANKVKQANRIAKGID